MFVWGCAGSSPERLDDDSGADKGEGGGNGGGDGDVVYPDSDAQDGEDARVRDASHADADADGGSDEELPPVEFLLSTTAGTAPLQLEATPVALPYSARWDWGEGAGFEATNMHRYAAAGDYTVQQQVLDEDGKVLDTEQMLVKVAPFSKVGFSTTDKTECAHISPDGLQIESLDWGPCGARTSASIAPGSGVFYFEGKRIAAGATLGVGAGSIDLLSSIYAATDGMGVLGWGPIRAGNVPCSGADGVNLGQYPDTGYVIDYRAASPTVHVITGDGAGGASVAATCRLNTSAPVFGMYSGERRTVGYEVQLNTGADTVNVPFAYGADAVKAALTAANAGDAAGAIVMGFGGTRAGRPGSKPTLTLSGPTVASVGAPVTITGVAQDADDGNLSGKIVWSDLSTLHHVQPNKVNAASYTFTPTEVGRHPIRAVITDSDGVIVTAETVVEVRGTQTVLPFAQVKLVKEATTGEGIVLSGDGLSAHFEVDKKMGVRANQGLYGAYWYFEVRRNTPVRNMGMGVVIKEGSLNPYTFHDVPWSMSINVSNGFWHDLIGSGAYSPGPDTESPEVYGFAVDYRGQHPIVHVIARGALQGTLELTDVWTPVHPLVYGNGGGPAGAMDMTVNFGTSAFTWNPSAILGAKASGIQLGWGR